MENSEKATKTYIVIKRTITVIDRVPFTPNHYPDMTIDQARNYEADQEFNLKIENVIDCLYSAEEKDIDFGEVIMIEEL